MIDLNLLSVHQPSGWEINLESSKVVCYMHIQYSIHRTNVSKCSSIVFSLKFSLFANKFHGTITH